MSSAEQQALEIKCTDPQQHDLSIPGREVLQNRLDISPEAPAFKHKRPGEEIIYVLEGPLEGHSREGELPGMGGPSLLLVLGPLAISLVGVGLVALRRT